METGIFFRSDISVVCFLYLFPDNHQIPIMMSSEGPQYNLTQILTTGWNLVSFADIMMVSADEAFRSVEEFWSLYYRI